MGADLPAPAISPERLARIAAQVERLESREADWAREPLGGELSPGRLDGEADDVDSVPDTASPPFSERAGLDRWDWRRKRGKMIRWGDSFKELAAAMNQRVRQPFSLRTQQISMLCAFLPFAVAVLSAGIRLMPRMPTLQLWSKVTWFVALPTFLAMAGALVGFLIGVMLDTLERQVEDRQSANRAVLRDSEVTSGLTPVGVRSGVWVAVEDLEPNQRVVETVTGEDGTPILLRHTLLKPAHVEMLREQNVDRVKVEVMKYPS